MPELVQVVPEVPFASIDRGLSEAELQRVKSAGCLVVKGAVSQDEAREWDCSLREYIAVNRDKVKGKSHSIL